ncbi:MAG TPA: prepilin-type N-terminal cleavage/methylation domain-containing protein [Bdellovibrionota bacterium]|nr:prepilin-type N-terminal cleavage/methylation domain-containing protein [Bdellovibrionota bacterium]
MRFPRLRDTSGFTLVEMMAVAAVIAVLAALTVPKFMRMVNKANQKGAVVLLTAGYMAQKNFVVENGAYTTCLRNIGMASPAGKLWYTVGINGAGIPNVCGLNSNQSCNSVAYDEGVSVAPCAKATCPTTGNDGDTVCATYGQASGTSLPGPNQLGTQAGDVTNTTFVIRAAGNISSGSGYDRWFIDQTGNAVNSTPNF